MYRAGLNAVSYCGSSVQFLPRSNNWPVGSKLGVGVVCYAGAIKSTAELIVSETTEVMPRSNNILHCIASVAEDEYRSAGSVKTVLPISIPGSIRMS